MDDNTNPGFWQRNGRWARWLIPNPGTLILLALFAFAAPSLAQRGLSGVSSVSISTIPYQGRLAATDGTPITNQQNMEFRLYDVPAGGAPLWEEYWTGGNSVAVSDGLFSVMLGSLNTDLTNVVQTYNNLYLGVTVGTDPEMKPRVQLGSVPFSIWALNVADGSITEAKIANDAVTTSKIANDAISTSKIIDGEVTTSDLASNAITTDKIADGSVGNGDLAPGAVTSDKIANGAVDTNQLVLGAVTSMSTINITGLAKPHASTQSTTFVDVPGFEIIMETNGNPVLILFQGNIGSPTDENTYLDFTVDGVSVSGAINGITRIVSSRNSTENATTLWTVIPSAGEHTFRMQWRIGNPSASNGKAWINRSDMANQFSVIEFKR